MLNTQTPRTADFGYSWTFALNSMDVQLDDQRQDITIGGNNAPFADDEEDDNGLPKVVSIRTGGGWDVTLTLPDGRLLAVGQKGPGGSEVAPVG